MPTRSGHDAVSQLPERERIRPFGVDWMGQDDAEFIAEQIATFAQRRREDEGTMREGGV
jgi:hypothetical protein